MGQHVVHGVVGRLDPGGVPPCRLGGGEVPVPDERHLQSLLAQVQPGRPDRAPGSELLEDHGDDAADGFVGVPQDLTVALAPDQAGGQPAAQLAASCLAPDPAVEPGPQDVQLGLLCGLLRYAEQAAGAPGGPR